MKRIILLGFAGFIIVLVYFGVQASIERSRAKVMTIEDYQQQDGIPVTTTTAELRELKSVLSYTGTIKGIEQADVTSAVQIEKVLDIHVKPGQKVRKGALLVTLDNRITSTYKVLNDRHEDAKLDLERAEKLYGAGAVSKQTLDKAGLAFKAAQAEIDAMMWRHKVVAPISGTVTDVFVELGQTVMTGTPLVRVAQLDRVETEINVAETEIAMLKTGQEAIIGIQSYPGRKFTGSVSEISLSTNPSTRTFRVKVEIPNEDGILKPGMFSDVDLVVGRAENAVSIPADALIKENGGFVVFVVQNDTTVKKVQVTPKLADGEYIEIPDGIAQDDVIVIEGQNMLTDGAKIKIVS